MTTSQRTPDFVIVPRGPFSLARAANVIASFPPLRHQPKSEDGVVRLGFIADKTFEPVAVSIRTADYLGVLRVTVHGNAEAADVRKQVARIFSLDVDGTTFPEIAARDPKLAPLMKQLEGLRPVSFTSPYECACWAIISQRISTSQAANIVRALVERHGPTIETPDFTMNVFPPPSKLLELDAMPSLPPVKIERLHGVARAALEGKLDAGALRGLGEEEALARLRALPGIGDFWSAGIWLRACGVADRFPDEPISIAALGALHGLGDHPSPAKLAELTARYRPFGMWIAFLLRVAASRGELGEIAGREMAIRRSSERRAGNRAASTRRRARRAA
jgi:DNA-3-methyladenine glycosylase II